MLNIEYNETSFEDLLKNFARQIKGRVTGNLIQLPADVGEGTVWQITLHNQIQLLLYDFTPKESLVLQRKKSNKDYYVLRFDDVAAVQENHESKSSVFFTHTRQSSFYMATPGIHICGVNFLFDKECLNAFFANDEAGANIQKYMDLKMTGPYNFEMMDAEYSRLLHELLNAGDEKKYEGLIVMNRAMLLMERFFTRFFKKITATPLSIKISSDEIARLRLVEHELIKDFTAEPPTIPILARLAAMSPSKLKQTFKEIYGLPVYQYYQKHRMNKAKAMLLSKNYSEHEVAEELGFANRSNFIKAFHKSFGQTPEPMSVAS